MYCVKCGQQLPDDANFCSRCGVALKGDDQGRAAPTQIQARTQAMPRREFAFHRALYRDSGSNDRWSDGTAEFTETALVLDFSNGQLVRIPYTKITSIQEPYERGGFLVQKTYGLAVGPSAVSFTKQEDLQQFIVTLRYMLAR